ncbi:GBF-interacting protein 1-like isoform X3 [Dioscorea cayenensis subsp. rotundata]|uniref:GBF-interacting protein 1-like isoform X3 n=1 Tax=Dioscorea cayennensis subsp. rotundata TaxID=55577 RepID=A0AB40CSC9_DIOCR|nr:GBF-interacting protein 1-like isoform X3 [Dioscorea cayenensis subsp. rotundata]
MSARVAIPANVRRMIQDIKEIAGNHGDEEVYAVLKECSMDPNETAQRLLFQDTFHEVKRKRDKRKESNKEPTDSRWRSGVEGRGGRGGRANYSSRHVANDAGGGKNANAGRENGAEIVNANSPSPLIHDAEMKSRIPMQSSFGALANGTSNVKSSFSSHGSGSQVSYVNCMAKAEEIFTTNSNKKGTNIDSKISSVPSQQIPVSAQRQSSMTPSHDSEIFVSASDPVGSVLVPNLDVGAPGVVGSTKSEGGSQSAIVETVKKIKSPRNETKQPLDVPLQMPPSSLAPSISSRPSSNYSNRSQQLSSLHKGIIFLGYYMFAHIMYSVSMR